jgi:hypothetical protein
MALSYRDILAFSFAPRGRCGAGTMTRCRT